MRMNRLTTTTGDDFLMEPETEIQTHLSVSKCSFPLHFCVSKILASETVSRVDSRLRDLVFSFLPLQSGRCILVFDDQCSAWWRLCDATLSPFPNLQVRVCLWPLSQEECSKRASAWFKGCLWLELKGLAWKTWNRHWTFFLLSAEARQIHPKIAFALKNRLQDNGLKFNALGMDTWGISCKWRCSTPQQSQVIEEKLLGERSAGAFWGALCLTATSK